MLAQAKVLYADVEFEKCIAKLASADRWGLTLEERKEVLLYRGLCEAASGQSALASRAFAALLEAFPTARLPAFTSPKIQALFEQVRAVQPKPRPSDRPARVELSSPPSFIQGVAPTPAPAPAPPSRVGVLVLSGVAVGALSAGFALGVDAHHLEGLANDATQYETAADRDGTRALQEARFANVAFVAAGSCAVAAGLWFFLQRRGPVVTSSTSSSPGR